MHMNAQHCACNPHAIRGAGENQIFVACRESIRVICCDGPFASSCRKLHAKYMCFEQEWQGCVSLCMRGHARGRVAVTGVGAMLNRKQRACGHAGPFVWPTGDPKTPRGSVPLHSGLLHGDFLVRAARGKKKWASASPMRSIGQAAPRCLAIPHAHEN